MIKRKCSSTLHFVSKGKQSLDFSVLTNVTDMILLKKIFKAILKSHTPTIYRDVFDTVVNQFIYF